MQAYLNGRYLPFAEAAIPLYDAGFVLGTTVAEQLRTFGGKLFRLDEHLARLERSLEIIEVDPGLDRAEFVEIAQRLVVLNRSLLDPDDDLGLAILVTPGVYATLADGHPDRPTVCLYTYPLPFRLWHEKYQQGQSLVTTDVQQVPQACWPAELKCRSRMHYYLADRRAAAREPGARALLLDGQEHVTETTTTNVLIYRRGEGLVSPPRATVLPGVSLRFAQELAGELSLSFVERPLAVTDVTSADEVLLTATTSCLVPATRFNGAAIGDGRPGPIFNRLLAAWTAAVGIDIAAQAARFANRAAVEKKSPSPFGRGSG